MRKKKQTQIITVEEYSIPREIAELQLEKLREIARIGLLTYEQAKIFDLLTKNLFLAKGEATGIIDTNRIPEQLPKSEQDELLQIAQFVQSEKISDILNVVEDAKDGSDQDPSKQS